MTIRQPLLFIGARGLARETLAAVRAAPDSSWDPIGFLDDDPATHGKEIDGLSVLGSTSDVRDHPDAGLALCVASSHDPGRRRAVASQLALPRDRYATVVHPAANIAAGTELGAGSILLAGVTVTAPQRLGDHVVAMSFVVFTHDDQIGDFVTAACGVRVSGHVTIGSSAYLGCGALVRENVWIGAEAVLGMGAVVLRDVRDREVWAGNPARFLRRNPPSHAYEEQ